MPWDLLGIQPTQDVRAIKRAYAQQLKHTRPDDDPLAFQQLHQAYKTALALAANDTTAPQETPDIDTAEVIDSASTPEPLSYPDTEAITLRPSAEAPKEAVSQWISNAKQYLSTPEGRSQPQQWQPLFTRAELLDDGFHHAAGQELFRLIAEQYQATGELADVAVLSYLNAFFHWTSQRTALANTLGSTVCDPIFARLDALSAPPVEGHGIRGGKLIGPSAQRVVANQDHDVPPTHAYGSYSIRILAFVMDLFFVMVAIAILLVGPIKMISGTQSGYESLLLLCTLPGYLLMGLIMETTPLQATPGKYLLGLRVVNRHGQRLPFWHNGLRVIAFILTGLLWKVIFIVNAFLGGRLLHDRISRTVVISQRSANGGY